MQPSERYANNLSDTLNNLQSVFQMQMEKIYIYDEKYTTTPEAGTQYLSLELLYFVGLQSGL